MGGLLQEQARGERGAKAGANIGAKARGRSTGMKDMGMQCDHNCREVRVSVTKHT